MLAVSDMDWIENSQLETNALNQQQLTATRKRCAEVIHAGRPRLASECGGSKTEGARSLGANIHTHRGKAINQEMSSVSIKPGKLIKR